MIHEYQLRILPEQAACEQSLKQYISREKGLDIRTINAIRTLKRSIDARQRTITSIWPSVFSSMKRLRKKSLNARIIPI